MANQPPHERPNLGVPPGEHYPPPPEHIHVHVDLGGLIPSLDAIQARLERIEQRIMSEQTQIQGIDQKLNDVSNGFAAVIDSAVARITTEIQKQGGITPETQAALDHLSATADGLQALNASSIDRIANAGAPPVVPPTGPIPEPPAEPGGGTDTGGGGGGSTEPPLTARRRQ